MFQNPLDKPNTRTSNILEQPEFSPGWCTVDAGVVGRVVGDERDVVFEGGRGDPGVGYSYGASLATRSVGTFGPPEAQGAVEGIDDKVAQMLLHPGAACLPQLRSSAHRSSSATVMKETTRSPPVRWGR